MKKRFLILTSLVLAMLTVRGMAESAAPSPGPETARLGLAAPPVHAVIEAQTNRPGWFVMHITNVSSNSIRFLDIQEGTGWCGDFYEVTVERDGKRYTSNGNCAYAPGAEPMLVELAAGQTYRREIQPGAYVFQAYKASATQITVTYRLSARIKDFWKSRPARADLDLIFQTSGATKAKRGAGHSGMLSLLFAECALARRA